MMHLHRLTDSVTVLCFALVEWLSCLCWRAASTTLHRMFVVCVCNHHRSFSLTIRAWLKTLQVKSGRLYWCWKAKRVEECHAPPECRQGAHLPL